MLIILGKLISFTLGYSAALKLAWTTEGCGKKA